MNKYWEHFKLVMTHKKYVFQFCCKAGIPWRGIKHDLSKFSPTEFFESAKYFTGERSPIEISKQVNGVSKAWQHHKGRNTHHWQYWLDNTDEGIIGRMMPFEDCVEMLCDQFAAGKAYKKEDWSLNYQRGWWEKKAKVHRNFMHPVVLHFMNDIYCSTLDYTYEEDFFDEIFNYDYLEDRYYKYREYWEDHTRVD